MITDGQNYFSDLANGDKPTLVQDTASAYVIDQQGKGSIFSEGGGANKALWLKAVVQAAFTTSASGTIAVVLQDSADNSSWSDVLVGPAIAAATAVVGYDLIGGNVATRMPSKLRRYLRIIYRIATGAMTAGTVVAFMTPELDLFDTTQRPATGTIAAPTGAADESVANGVLAG